MREETFYVPSSVGEIIPVLCSVDVAFGSGSPEYWPDVFFLTLWMGADGPGQRSPKVHIISM